MAQKAGHRYRWALTLTAALAGAGACTEDPVTEDYVPARPGAVQAGEGGDALDEAEACARIRDAEEEARERMQCRPLERPPCPFYVRPAGTGCWEYSEESVTACEEVIANYATCFDFDDQPCVLTASEIDDPCEAPPILGGAGASAGGAAGASAGGAAGDAGAPAGGAPAAGAGGAAGGVDGSAGATLGGAGGAPVAGAGGV